MSPLTYCHENSAQKPGVRMMPIQVSSATRILPSIEISRYSNATPAVHSAADSSSPMNALRPGNSGRPWASITTMPMQKVEASSSMAGELANRSSMLFFRLRPQAGAVAAAFLGLVERLVGMAENLVQRVAILGIDGDPGREGALNMALSDVDLLRGEIAAPIVDAGQRLFPGGARQQDQDLFAAGAEDEIALANPLGQELADRGQHPVAGLMAVMIIEPLEIIEIDHDDRQRLALPVGLGGQLAADLVKEAAVMQAGQRIPCSLLAQLHFQADAPGDVAQQQHPPDLAPTMGQRYQGDLEPSVRRSQRNLGRHALAGRQSVQRGQGGDPRQRQPDEGARGSD